MNLKKRNVYISCIISSLFLLITLITNLLLSGGLAVKIAFIISLIAFIILLICFLIEYKKEKQLE